MPKLSIITVNLNNAANLRRTIESVINQTYTDYEYLIIDGGSVDGSVEIIKEYAEKITYWISEPDHGIYNAMNKGILKSKGELLQFLNSGDWLVNTSTIENILHDIPNCDLLYGNMIRIMHDGKLQINYGPRGEEITFFTFFHSTINHPSSFIRRDLFFQYGLYDEELRIVSDWKFFLIAFGLHPSTIIYKNIDVSYFDMCGISNSQYAFAESERENVLATLIPYPILADYKKHKFDLIRLTIINRHVLTNKLYNISQKILILFCFLMNKITK